MEIPDTEVIKQLVVSGIGTAFLPEQAMKAELTAGTLQTVKGEEAVLSRWIYLLTAKDQHYCPTMLAFMSFVRKYQL